MTALSIEISYVMVVIPYPLPHAIIQKLIRHPVFFDELCVNNICVF